MASEKVSRKTVLKIKYVDANDAVIDTEISKLLFGFKLYFKGIGKNSCKQLWNERFSSVQVKVRVSR